MVPWGCMEQATPQLHQPVEDLVRDNLAFVVSVAKDYRNMGLDFEDLRSEGNVGLIKAALRYDPSRGTKFTTYAIWWIRKSILQALCDQSRTIRIPANHYKQRHKREDWSEPTIVRDAPTEPGRTSLLERLPEGRPDVETDLLSSEAQSELRWALERLTEQELLVLAHRYGLADQPCLTLREIGLKLGVSHERVRQIETSAKKRVRGWLNRRSLAVPRRSRQDAPRTAVAG